MLIRTFEISLMTLLKYLNQRISLEKKLKLSYKKFANFVPLLRHLAMAAYEKFNEFLTVGYFLMEFKF